MRNIARSVVFTLFVILFGAITAAQAQVSIGINITAFPRLVVVPGYPVYYAPDVRADYFFYDGLYWLFNVEDGYWYSSSWYNGPWVYVEPVDVPQFILVIPYRYYRVRPAYWSGWAYDQPPRWGQQWGSGWESSRRGWNKWDRRKKYVAAPLPLYQKTYAGHYPTPSQQVTIHNELYHYKPQDTHVQQQHEAILHKQSAGGAKAPRKAEGVVAAPKGKEKAQPREKAQSKEKGQRQEKAEPQEKGQGQEKGEEKGR